MSSLTAFPSSPRREASWSSRPVSAPHQSRSIREQRRASARGSGGSRSATAQSARQSAIDRAADDDSPAPRGTSPAISRRQGCGSIPSRRSSAAAPRTKRRQPYGAPALPGLGGRISGPSSKRSCWERSSAWATISVPAIGSAETVSPARNRERKAEAIVVVGVLTDQVYASRGESPYWAWRHGREPMRGRGRPWTDGRVARGPAPSYFRVGRKAPLGGPRRGADWEGDLGGT